MDGVILLIIADVDPPSIGSPGENILIACVFTLLWVEATQPLGMAYLWPGQPRWHSLASHWQEMKLLKLSLKGPFYWLKQFISPWF